MNKRSEAPVTKNFTVCVTEGEYAYIREEAEKARISPSRRIMGIVRREIADGEKKKQV